ncbi:MAG: hypothetical protein ABI779_13850 [Acidobacteriota bacterium]
MKAPRLAALAIAIAAALAVTLVVRDGWRVASPRVSSLPGIASHPLSAQECADLCKDAQMPLPGANAAMAAPELHALLVKQFGELSAKELSDARQDGRLIVTDGQLFFPTALLCRQEHLSGDCAKLCEAWRPR